MTPTAKEKKNAPPPGRLACFGPVCQGREYVPKYYFGRSGYCVECEAAMQTTRRRRGDDREHVRQRKAAADLGDLMARVESADMSLDEATVLRLFYFDGLICDEIAALPYVQCDVRTVERRLQRAHDKLEAAGLPEPHRPQTPRTKKWAPEMFALLTVTGSGRYRLHQPGTLRTRRDSDRRKHGER